MLSQSLALQPFYHIPCTPHAARGVCMLHMQLTEFLNDFTARDVGRLITALADLRMGPALSADFNTKMMKAVYSKVCFLT